MATSHKGLFLNQRKYILDLLQDANMEDCKPAHTPLDTKLQLNVSSEPLFNLTSSQRLVGKLIYLTITRPDISYAVSIVSQFMLAPTLAHLHIVKQILRYLKSSVGRGPPHQGNNRQGLSEGSTISYGLHVRWNEAEEGSPSSFDFDWGY
ncbi:uncharacterized mitochondrial protein AtMg00810-like [Rosa chinensis]|uniref:uncharacterized mitochondrial protein AtMg00810-like n=1 Tax=Rosa chinensis TaxID=74649 RepID=UPI000D08997C|nr:uncharacterized mitochondrial protein AtMg00810-like [Rosa chinensis]